MTQQVATKEGGIRTMTQADAARRAGCTRACWSAWEAGKRFPRAGSWLNIVDALWPLTPDEAEGMVADQRKIYDARRATSRRKRR